MVYAVTCSLLPMIAAPLVCNIIGMLWYGPLFGQQWLAEVNLSLPKKPPMLPLVLTLVANVLTTFIMINIHHILAVSSLQQAILIAWIYWAATIGLRIPHYAFQMKSLRLFLIDGVFDVAVSVAISACVFYLHNFKF